MAAVRTPARPVAVERAEHPCPLTREESHPCSPSPCLASCLTAGPSPASPGALPPSSGVHACGYVNQLSRALSTGGSENAQRARARVGARAEPQEFEFRRGRHRAIGSRSCSETPYESSARAGFWPAWMSAPGTSRKRIGRFGRKPASRCQLAIFTVRAAPERAEQMLAIGTALAQGHLAERHPQQHDVPVCSVTLDYLFLWSLFNRDSAARTAAPLARHLARRGQAPPRTQTHPRSGRSRRSRGASRLSSS